MNPNTQIWREKQYLLGFLAILLAANIFFFFTYRVRYAKRLGDLDTRVEQAEGQLQQARNARLLAERQFAAYEQVQHDIKEVYEKRWATQEERLTALLAEVKRLAVASQLVPTAYSFTRTDQKIDKKTTGGEYGATLVGIAFTVQGNYQQARRLINLLELSDQFVIIDQVSLTQGNDQVLTLTLHVKTLFRTGPPLATRDL